MKILGIDLGNAFVKTSSGIIIESKISTKEPLYTTDKIVINKNPYWIGSGNYDTTYRKVNKESYIPLLLSAIALSTDKPVCIALGLPVSQYLEDKKELINLVLNHSEEKIILNDIEKMIKIDDVEVFPEGIITLEDDFEGIVIDIGGRTTDCALVTNCRGKRKINNPFSMPIGTINLYINFINILNSKFGLDLKLQDAERILINGLYLDGKRQDIGFATNIYKDFVQELITNLNVEYSLRTNFISLTGGGSIVLHSYFKELLGDNVILQEDSLMANANAYYEVGCCLWQ